MQKKLANGISRTGHPIILGTVLALYINFTYFTKGEAKELSFRLLLGIVLPLCIFLIVQIKRGYFKDMDVSNASKRNQLYVFLLILILIQIAFYIILGGNRLVLDGFVMMACYVAVCYIFNLFGIKVSLHTSFAFLTSLLCFKLASELSASLFLFALLVAYSRVILGRHSYKEVLVGAMVGISLGLIFTTYLQI